MKIQDELKRLVQLAFDNETSFFEDFYPNAKRGDSMSTFYMAGYNCIFEVEDVCFNVERVGVETADFLEWAESFDE